MNFKFNQKNVFLTFPKCSLSKERVLQGLEQVAEIQDYVISIEAHKDGTPHVHAFIKFKERYHTTSPRAFDLGSFHPNIETPKTASDCRRVIAYVQKCGDFLTNISVKKSATQLLGEELLREGLTPQVVHANPTLLFKNFTQIRMWLNFARPSISLPLSLDKKRHVWLHGPSNSGKTYWLRAVTQLYSSCEIPCNNDWSHLTPDVELVYADEYRGGLTVQELNRICDGRTRLNTKGGSIYLPEIMVLIISNFSISDCYKNCPNHILDTIYNRFNEYDSSINLPRFPVFIIKK